MSAFPKAITSLIKALSALPDVGPKTAAKFTFYLKGRKQAELDELASLIRNLRRDTATCPGCFRTVESLNAEQGEVCEICSSNARDQSTIVILEKEVEVEAFERAGYKGTYFVSGPLLRRRVGGAAGISLTPDTHGKGSGIQEARLKVLGDRLRSEQDSNERDKKTELIIAFNPTPQGDASASYLAQALKKTNIKITRLGRGLPTGADLRYADKDTLQGAFRGRTKV